MLNLFQKKTIEFLKSGQGFDKEVLYSLVYDENQIIKDNLYTRARELTDRYFGRKIYFRGLIEFTNYCKKNCYYCGLRFDNKNLLRYRMGADDIVSTAEYGYRNGFRTFVLQGGEDSFFSDDILEDIIHRIKSVAEDAAITLSIGERSESSYERLKNAGADRYLLRHESIDEELYSKLHPLNHSLTDRILALRRIKGLGYQTGAGFMVGAPFQSRENIINDLMFLKEFEPYMVGIGPFISNKDTPFHIYENGSVDLTLRLLSVIRVILPKVLLPATTSLETICKDGRIRGFEHGANVIMPNLTPELFRNNYKLYDNKSGVIADYIGMKDLREKLEENGFELVIDRGDYK